MYLESLFWVYLYLPIHLPSCPSTQPSIHSPIHLPNRPPTQSSVHQPSIHQSFIYPSIHPTVHLPITHPSTQPSIHPMIHPPKHSSNRPSIYSYIHIFNVCCTLHTEDTILKREKTQSSLSSSGGNGHQSMLMATVTTAITRWACERRSDPRGQEGFVDK